VALSACLARESLSGLSSGPPTPEGGDGAHDVTRGSDGGPAIDAKTAMDATVKGDATAARDAKGAPDTLRASDAMTSSDTAPADAACPIVTELAPCTTIPRFTGTQVVDGVGNDFCGYPGVFFDVLDGGATTPEGGAVPRVGAHIQVAWSTAGLHVFVHVDEAVVIPAPSSMFAYNGDAIEVFASADGVLTGPFGGDADKALQVIVSPPTGSQAAADEITTSVTGPLPSLPATAYAARLVDGGYDVELHLSWSTLASSPVPSPQGGTWIGLDVACDVHGDGGHHQSLLSLHVPTAPPASCGQLYCDDRTWCLWRLAP